MVKILIIGSPRRDPLQRLRNASASWRHALFETIAAGGMARRMSNVRLPRVPCTPYQNCGDLLQYTRPFYAFFFPFNKSFVTLYFTNNAWRSPQSYGRQVIIIADSEYYIY